MADRNRAKASEIRMILVVDGFIANSSLLAGFRDIKSNTGARKL